MSFFSPAIVMKLQRNDTVYPEIVELSAWEWCDVPMDAIRGI